MRHPVICLIAAAGLLTGCSPAHNTAVLAHMPYLPITALVIADGVGIMATGKTMEDHVVGWIAGKDCSVVRASHGEDYCISKDPPPKVAVVAYCYHTLAKTTCYDRKIASDAGTYGGSRLDMVPVSALR